MPKAKTTQETDIRFTDMDSIQYVAPNTEFPFVYANNALLNLSEVDGSILFGEVVGKDGDKTIVVPKVKVIMARPFLVKLRELIARTLEQEAAKTKD